VLGDVVVDDGDRVVPIASRNQRVILATLATQPRLAVGADRLIDAVWGDEPPPSAVGSLRTYVSRLRRLLGDAVTISAAGYCLDLPDDEIDLGRFHALADRAATTRSAERLALLEEALACWRGDAFGDLADVEVLRPAATQLEARRVAVLEDRAAALLDARRLDDAVAAAEAVVAEHPLREHSWAVLIEALTADRRVAEALRAYQRAVHALAEAGLVPSERLRRAEAAAVADEAVTLDRRTLAPPASSLVGRDADVVAVAGMVDRHRLVTLVGPGGVGKTRLAGAVAAAVADRFEWGARVVELAEVSSSDAVPDAVAHGLGLEVEPGAPLRALERAGRLDLLVVLDNCEHLIDATAAVAEALVTGGTRVRVLATSREALGVDGEHRWPVQPLPTASPGGAAYELFIDRARAVRPDLELAGDDRAAIHAVVQRLDGLPLAIEMAAARAATMALPELARRLDEELALLNSSRRTAEPRHRTLAALVEWSERLLDERDRDLFSDLAIFESAASAEAVELVIGRPSPIQSLSRLAERSLIVVDTSGNTTRFGMLRTVRDRAQVLLDGRGRRDELARRHAEYVERTAVEIDRMLRGPDEPAAGEHLGPLLAEARAAHAWALEHDVELAIRTCGALCLFAQTRLQDEVLGWSAALAAEAARRGGPGSAGVLTAAAQRAVNAGAMDHARALALEAVALSDETTSAMAFEILSDTHLLTGELDEARAVAEAGYDAATAAGDMHGVVVSVISRALASAYGGDVDEAMASLADAPERSRLGPSDQAWLCYAEGETLLDRDIERAVDLHDRAVALADSVGNRYLSGVARVSATSLRARAGDPLDSLEAFAAVIEHWRGQATGPHLLTTLRNLVVLLQRVDAVEEAAELLGSVESSEASPTFGEEAARLDIAHAWVIDRLGETEAQRRMAIGASRSADDAAVAMLDWISATGA
jgi:predicted ATPase/DNA-binding SARP family transcriptional activator